SGTGQAWLYDPARYGDQDFHPLDTPGQMGALTAVGCQSDGSEFCFAGGLRQIWTFKDGDFIPDPYTDQSPATQVDNGAAWQFRVRQIRFNPRPSSTTQVAAFAVTDGCCTQEPSTPKLLVWDGKEWFVRQLMNDASAHPTGAHGPPQ